MDWLTNSPVLSGSIALGVGGMLWQALKDVPARVFGFVRRRIVVELQITSDESEAMLWVKHWLTTRARSARTYRPHVEWPDTHADGMPRLDVLPGVGTYWLRTDLGWCLVSEDREKSEGMGQSYQYTLNLRFLRATPITLAQFLAHCHTHYMAQHVSAVQVFSLNYQDWDALEGVQQRDLESVVLADGQVEEITADLTTFLARREWYRSLGVPYRRGYLFTGPPGTGKSSLALALASHFGMRLYILQLSTLSDHGLLRSLAQIRGRAIVLLEDIDAVFHSREDYTDPALSNPDIPPDVRAELAKTKSPLTLSGLLNALDGAASTEGRLLIMTSNYPDRLDPALVRSGRIDRQWVLNHASASQAERLYRRFFPDGDPTDFVAWATAVPRAMCDLQETLLQQAWSCPLPGDAEPPQVYQRKIRTRRLRRSSFPP